MIVWIKPLSHYMILIRFNPRSEVMPMQKREVENACRKNLKRVLLVTRLHHFRAVNSSTVHLRPQLATPVKSLQYFCLPH
jgi:hypothetical protein